MMLNAIDLFSGAGGMSEGLLQAGFKVIFSSDINKDVAITHTERQKQLGYIHGQDTYYHCGDIRHLTGDKLFSSINMLGHGKNFEKEDIDALFGGPPCQGFSRAGLRCQSDPRNYLFMDYLRVINETRPKYVVTENVEGFLGFKLSGYKGFKKRAYPDHTSLVDILHEEFKVLGYETIEPKTLNAAYYGVPQNRRRAIFIAYLKGLKKPDYPETAVPKQENQLTVRTAIGDIITGALCQPFSIFQIESRLGRTPGKFGKPVSVVNIENHEMSTHSNVVEERFRLYLEGENTTQLVERLKRSGIDIKNVSCLYSMFVEKHNKLATVHKQDISTNEEFINFIVSKKRSRQKLDMDRSAPTVMTLPDDYIIPAYNRIPTVREMARLQSFDDSFVFFGSRTTGGQRRRHDVPQYTQVGNAVPPLLAKSLAQAISRCF